MMTELPQKVKCTGDGYANYGSYAVRFHAAAGTLEFYHERKGWFAKEVKFAGFYNDEGKLALDFNENTPCECEYYRLDWKSPNTKLFLNYPGSEPVTVIFEISRNGIKIMTEPDTLIPAVSGFFCWGDDPGSNTFAVSIGREGADLRSGFGPAASEGDNALFDRADGTALLVEHAEQISLRFDWNINAYTFDAKGSDTVFSVREHLFEDIYKTKYKPVNKSTVFKTPPCGFMTWYAVKFDACEKAVLDNARFMKESLSDFGADTIWVDWEWYHSKLNEPGPTGIDFFAPDPVRYPNGMKSVADQLREMGLIPAIWIGITTEPAAGEFIRQNPEALLAKEQNWCGEYFYDLTHPAYLSKYLPAAAKQIQEWGYEAIKWDCLSITLAVSDRNHFAQYQPEITSENALRSVIKQFRKLMGGDYYMLSCSGQDRSIAVEADLFDGVRIGQDIFSWKNFSDHFINRIFKLYSYHNICFYCDPDNLVLRPEFNSFDEAVSRISVIALLGLPVTIGDNLPDLPPERVELLKRALPALDAHPRDIRESVRKDNSLLINLAVERSFERWNVIDILNLNDEPAEFTVDFKKDLGLGNGEYLVYDFWNKTFSGKLEDSYKVKLDPHASAVLSIRQYLGRIQLLSTSRHISQGAIDLTDVTYDGKKDFLRVTANCVKDDPYTITAYSPQSGVITKTVIPEKSGEICVEIYNS